MGRVWAVHGIRPKFIESIGKATFHISLALPLTLGDQSFSISTWQLFQKVFNTFVALVWNAQTCYFPRYSSMLPDCCRTALIPHVKNDGTDKLGINLTFLQNSTTSFRVLVFINVKFRPNVYEDHFRHPVE